MDLTDFFFLLSVFCASDAQPPPPAVCALSAFFYAEKFWRFKK